MTSVPKRRILELGSGNNPRDNAEHLDRDAGAKDVQWVGDVRGLWSQDFTEGVGNLSEIPEEAYDEVFAQHFIEHVEWIYQPSLFKQIFEWLKPGGKVVIETPNLPHILQYYVKNRKRNTFPTNEHPWIQTREGASLQRWLNFKLFSGCSPGDYHHCIYDKHLLREVMERAGFVRVKTSSGVTLWGFGYKPSRPESKEPDFF